MCEPKTEAEIRDLLVEHLAKTRQGSRAAFIAEMFFDGFSRRADLILVDGTLSAFEIKSDKDSLDRLEGQLDTYSRFFEQVTVVCAARHLQKVQTLAAQGVGIWVVAGNGRFSVVRQAQTQALHSCATWLSFLPVDELKAFLREHRFRATGSRHDLVRFAEQAPLKAVRDYVLSYLKRRDSRIAALARKRIEQREKARQHPDSSVQKMMDHLARSLPETEAIPRLKRRSSLATATSF
jgi:hypothetical protein